MEKDFEIIEDLAEWIKLNLEGIQVFIQPYDVQKFCERSFESINSKVDRKFYNYLIRFEKSFFNEFGTGIPLVYSSEWFMDSENNLYYQEKQKEDNLYYLYNFFNYVPWKTFKFVSRLYNTLLEDSFHLIEKSRIHGWTKV